MRHRQCTHLAELEEFNQVQFFISLALRLEAAFGARIRRHKLPEQCTGLRDCLPGPLFLAHGLRAHRLVLFNQQQVSQK